MANLISFTTPLPANGTQISGPQYLMRAQQITGTVYVDQPGDLYIDQGGDGINWDTTTHFSVPNSTITGVGVSFEVDVVSQYFQVRYVNGNLSQTIFRLYANARDAYGAFLANALPASAGGQYGVLLWNDPQQEYRWIGRFDGSDPYGAITAAVNATGVGGKYACFAVALAAVSQERPVFTTEHSPDAF